MKILDKKNENFRKKTKNLETKMKILDNSEKPDGYIFQNDFGELVFSMQFVLNFYIIFMFSLEKKTP